MTGQGGYAAGMVKHGCIQAGGGRPLASGGVGKAVIVAGGFGTRLLPATKVVPKEMLPVGREPAIQHVVAEAAAAGLRNILIVYARGKELIADHFDAAPELENHLAGKGKAQALEAIRRPARLASFHFTRQPQPLGLAHAVGMARSFVGDEPFALLLPDELFFGEPPCIAQVVAAYERYGGTSIAYREVAPSEVDKYGIIDPGPPVAGQGESVVGIRGLVEKPAPETAPSTLAITGRYVLTPSIFTAIDAISAMAPGRGGEFQLTDALHHLAAAGEPLYGVAVKGLRYDVGTFAGWLAANQAVAAGKLPGYGTAG